MKNKYFLFIYFINIILNSNEPRLTIITSVFKGDRFIEHFLEQISNQRGYDEYQHIIINANSPENEEIFIFPFLKKHKNAEYYRLEKDPGLYAVWNMAIEKSKAPYLVNANLDDRLAFFAYSFLLEELDSHPEIDLVYSDAYITNDINQVFGKHSYCSSYTASEFSYKALQEGCFIGSHPIWRKSMHEKYGFFNEKFFAAGDWEMWLRAANQGALFLHVNCLTAVNYLGPETITNRRDLVLKREWEYSYLKNNYQIK